LKEYSLSCACPAVVDKINNIAGKMKFLLDGEENSKDGIPSEDKIRETMIRIMQNSKFSLKDRILLVFNMLLFMKKELIITNENISKYQDEKYLLSLVDIWNGKEINNEDSCKELNELFLDIVQNYKKVKNFSYYLKDISDLAENLKIENSLTQWYNFKIEFGQYEKLIENCMVSKIFSNCISDDIDEMIMSFQLVITEYVMVRYSTFLIGLKNEIVCNDSQLICENNDASPEQSHSVKKKIHYSDIRDYIVIYTRIIGYNADGIREFWEDSFDEAVWEFGYMLFLID